LSIEGQPMRFPLWLIGIAMLVVLIAARLR
jgi:hypothetical protein